MKSMKACALVLGLIITFLYVMSEDGYDGYAYEYGYEETEGETEIGHLGEIQGGVPPPTANPSVSEGIIMKENKIFSQTGAPSVQRDKEKKEERRLETERLQAQLKEKQRLLAIEEERRAAALIDAATRDKERSDFVKSGGSQGYKKSVGGGMKKVIIPLANERYLDIMAMQMDCVPLKEWGIISELRNETAANDEKSKTRDALSRIDGTFEEEKKDEEEVQESKKERKFDNPKVKAKPKKPTFRELQEKKMQERKAKEAAKEAQRGSFLLGASCEGLVCASCKVLVEEFSSAVLAGVSNPEFMYVEDVLPPFCNRKEVQQRYVDLVSNMCETIVKERVGYKEAFLIPFEQDSVWTAAVMATSIMEKKKKVCKGL